jgi:hypothetical protein
MSTHPAGLALCCPELACQAQAGKRAAIGQATPDQAQWERMDNKMTTNRLRNQGAKWLLLATMVCGHSLGWAATAEGTHPASSAEAPPASRPDSATTTPSAPDILLSATRSTVRSSTEWLARGVDGWFGDIPFSQGGKVTDGEVGWNIYKREHESATRGIRFKARFRLPNLESYQYLFVGNDDRRDIVSDQPDTFSRQQQLLRNDTPDSTFFAGVGAAFLDMFDFRLGFRGGLKPYAQGRYRHTWQLAPADLVEFRETVFYSASDKLGSTTALSIEHTLSPTHALRWVHSVTSTTGSNKTNWSHSLGSYRSFGEQKQLAFEALLGGTIGSPPAIPDYGLQARWSQPVYDDYVIGEIVIGHFWPQPDPTQPRMKAWAVGTGIKLKF